MRKKTPVFHNALTLEMAKDLIREGGELSLGRHVDFMFEQRVFIAVKDPETRALRYVVEAKEGLPNRLFRMSDVVDLLFECGSGDKPVWFPLSEHVDF